MLFTETQLDLCELFERQAVGFPALRVQFNELTDLASQCKGQAALLIAQLQAEDMRSNALRAQLDARWDALTVFVFGAAVSAAVLIALVLFVL